MGARARSACQERLRVALAPFHAHFVKVELILIPLGPLINQNVYNVPKIQTRLLVASVSLIVCAAPDLRVRANLVNSVLLENISPRTVQVYVLTAQQEHILKQLLLRLPLHVFPVFQTHLHLREAFVLKIVLVMQVIH